MRISLFARLTLGYLVIFLLVAGVSTFAILQLSRFNRISASILDLDNRVLDSEKQLADLLLSQSRYEGKFVIAKDESLFKQYERLKEDFNVQLEQALALKNSVARPSLMKIAADYKSYDHLVLEEVQLVRANRSYGQARYKEEKNKLLDTMLTSLEQLRIEQERATHGKIQELATGADRATAVAAALGAGCMLAVISLSFWITRSITAPMALLKSRTREIAQGKFEGTLHVVSPPEIGELANALNSMSARLRELDRMKADFFATMSHELRTPLTSIKEGTGLLLDGVGGETTEKQRKLLAILAEESNRLIGVVNSLLDFSKMEAGMMGYDFEVTRIEPLVRRVISEITPLVEAKEIALQSNLEGKLPAVRLDPERILQVLRNLVGNAVKFTPKGGHVQVSATARAGKLEVSVQDSGPGIPAESLTAIFERFSQGNHKSVLTRQGTGLGLAIAQSIIKSHGGEIWAESQLGRGSKFLFILPC